MNEQQAKKILKHAIQDDNSLLFEGIVQSIHYVPGNTNKILLANEFTLEELKAIVWWMENKKSKN